MQWTYKYCNQTRKFKNQGFTRFNANKYPKQYRMESGQYDVWIFSPYEGRYRPGKVSYYYVFYTMFYRPLKELPQKLRKNTLFLSLVCTCIWILKKMSRTFKFQYLVSMWEIQEWNFSIHCVKSVRIRSFSGQYSIRMRENTDQRNSEYEHFSRSDKLSEILVNFAETNLELSFCPNHSWVSLELD